LLKLLPLNRLLLLLLPKEKLLLSHRLNKSLRTKLNANSDHFGIGIFY
jgi:hypothetical protein